MNKEEDIIKFKAKFAENLRHYRKEKNLTQAELAEEAELSTTIISDYENSRKKPGLFRANVIANSLGVTIDALCGIDIESRHESHYKSQPILATMSMLEKFKPQVHVNENSITLTVSTDNNCADYSADGILDFFKEYEIIQNLENHGATRDMIESLLSNLKKKYKHLPGLPLYCGNKTTADS